MHLFVYSLITKSFIIDARKFIHRTALLYEVKACDQFKTTSDCIYKEWIIQWSTQLHMSRFQLYLWTIYSRKQLASLWDLLTEQNRLQLYQYRINVTYSPVCTLLEDEEIAHHYIFIWTGTSESILILALVTGHQCFNLLTSLSANAKVVIIFLDFN